jgi:diadenosine tetraphosphate (Ap4A) HIT family hydrolase
MWLASREHVDSFSDLPPEAAADFGRVAARVERAILALGGIGRVHLYRWGDGGAHFHVWFIPRPLGMLEAAGMMLPLWEEALPNVSDVALREAAERVAARMHDEESRVSAGGGSDDEPKPRNDAAGRHRAPG